MSLLALQRDFRAWLTSGAADIPAGCGERASAGLAVYLNNYRSQLLTCLATTFPTVRAWIGDTAFDDAASAHVDRVRPRSWTLDAYGLQFPETLDALFHADPEIGELARLERELTVAFVGPDAAPINPTAFTHVDWDEAIICFVPTLTLLPVTTNVGAIWSAINAEQTPPPVARLTERECIAIWRSNFTSKFRTLAGEEVAVLGQPREGLHFAALCATLVERLGQEQGLSIAGSMLGQWLADGMIAQIS